MALNRDLSDKLINSTDLYAEYVEVEMERTIEMCKKYFPEQVNTPGFVELVRTVLGQSLLSSYTMIFIMRGKTTYIRKEGHPVPDDAFGLNKVKHKLDVIKAKRRASREKRWAKDVAMGVPTVNPLPEPKEDSLSQPFLTKKPGKKEYENSLSGGPPSIPGRSNGTTQENKERIIGSPLDTNIKDDTEHNARGNEPGQERTAGQGRGTGGDKDDISGGQGKPRLQGGNTGQP